VYSTEREVDGKDPEQKSTDNITGIGIPILLVGDNGDYAPRGGYRYWGGMTKDEAQTDEKMTRHRDLDRDDAVGKNVGPF